MKDTKAPADVTGLGPKPTRDEVFGAMQNGESDTMNFHVRRDTPQPGRTFSKEALEDFLENIRLFVVARMMNHWEDPSDKTVPGPSTMTVEVKVTVDGLHNEVPEDEVPWYGVDPFAELDGSRRMPH